MTEAEAKYKTETETKIKAGNQTETQGGAEALAEISNLSLSCSLYCGDRFDSYIESTVKLSSR